MIKTFEFIIDEPGSNSNFKAWMIDDEVNKWISERRQDIVITDIKVNIASIDVRNGKMTKMYYTVIYKEAGGIKVDTSIKL